MDLHKLFQKIIDLLTEKEVNIESLMLNLQVISHYLNNKEFASWIMNEMNGYKTDEEVPEYRVIKTTLMGNFMIPNFGGVMTYNKQVLLLPAEGEIRDTFSNYKSKESISKLLSFIKSTKGELQASTNLRYAAIIENLYDSDVHIYQMWQHLDVADFINIITVFKSKILDFIMDLNDNENLNLEFDKEIIQKKITYLIKAGVYADKGSVVNLSDSPVGIE